MSKTSPAAAADKKGQNREKSPIAQMITWSESVQKEKNALKIYENFTINPKNLHIVTEKPNENIILNMRRKEKEASPGLAITNENFLKTTSSNESPPLSQEILGKLSSINETPRQKYSMPVTANQEIGWYFDTHLTPKKSTFTYPKQACKETVYANDYYTMNKISPFSNKFK